MKEMHDELAKALVRAHQYLYYVKSTPVISDYDYDQFCSANGIDGKGGSDLAESYSGQDKQLAGYLLSKYGTSST